MRMESREGKPVKTGVLQANLDSRFLFLMQVNYGLL